MPKKTQLYSISFSSPEYKTLGAWISDPSSPIFCYNDKPDYFLDNIVGEDGLTNRQRIHEQFKTPDTRDFINSGFQTLPIHPGLLLYLEYSVVNQTGFVTEGIQVVSNDEAAFKAARLAELESDVGYVSVTRPIGGKLGVTKTSFPDCTVWIWIRALSPQLRNNEELTGQLFDLTPFVQRLTTSVSKNGGNWNLTLPPLMCEQDKEGTWVLKRGTVNQYLNDNNNSGTINYTADANMFEFDGDTGEAVKSKFFFNTAIGANDLILIRYDTLEMEKKQRYEDAKRFILDKQNLAGRIYDLIGLVDTVRESTNAESNDVVINISGRDLSKIFIEDGSYFYALENSQGILKVAGETRIKNSLISRNYADGGLRFLNLYMFQSPEVIFKFIFQQLSNIKVIPNDLLSSYGENRNTRFNELPAVLNTVKGNKDYKPQFKQEVANGIWQIINLIIDENITNRRLCDSSMSTAQGSILNLMRTAAVEPLVEMWLDTIGDKFCVILRKPPYDLKGYTTLIEGRVNTEGSRTVNPAIINIAAEDVLSENLMMETQVFSWYQFFPKGALINTRFDYSTSILPAVFFDEFAQVFGSKPFQQTHPYIPYVPKGSEGNLTSIMDRQAFYDLKYVIESSQYLPFSRRGTLVLNRDRRIKVGNIIRYLPTGEVFFVDAVQHNHLVTDNSIDATTVVEVSRGLVEQLIYGINYRNENGAEKFISYFSIVDTTLTFQDKEIVTDNYVQEEDGYEEVTTQATAPAKVQLTQYADFTAMNNNLLNTGTGQVTGVAHLEKYDSAPESKALFTRFINEITKTGYNVFIGPLSTNRTYAQQAALKALNPNNASPGHSRHEKFAAIDITVSKDGKTYGKNTAEAEWRATGVPFIATTLGLQWGGPANNGTFGNYIDRIHFEVPSNGTGNTTKIKKYKSVNHPIKTKGLDTDAVFSKFKVNSFTMNFFLKRLQFSSEYRVVKNRIIRNPDGSLPEVTVTGRKR